MSLLSTAFVLWMSIPSAPDFQLNTLSTIPQTIQAPFTGNVVVPPMNSYVIPKPCLPLMVIAGVTGGVISAGAASLLVAILGFTGIGPAAGSVAGSWQAAAGAVTAGSLFSTLQSAAMGGYGVWVPPASQRARSLPQQPMLSVITCAAIAVHKPCRQAKSHSSQCVPSMT